MYLYILIIIALFTVSEQNKQKSLNILGIFPYQGKSHFFVFEPYLQELALRGHNVTVISYFPRKEPMNNFKDISLAGKDKILENAIEIKQSYLSVIEIFMFLMSSGNENCRTLLENKNVQNLWKTNAKFDVIVVEQFNSDCALGLAHKLGAPVVGTTSHTLMPWHFERLGIPNNPSFVPSQFFGGGTKPSLYQRIERTLFNKVFNVLYKILSQRVTQNTIAEHLDDVPSLEELARNIKFKLVYTNCILFGSTLLPSNVIEVGGYHVAKPKSLPDEIEKFISESKHEVIFISFGSMLKSTTAPVDKIEAIIKAVSSLPQRVIWKWDETTLPGNPKNIFVSKWLPQNDILAHPKVTGFISHCGLLSTTEAIYHGVPIVGIPIFGDQPANAAAIEESGFGVQIQINQLTAEILSNKLKTILDPGFRERVTELSKAWHDRPISPMDAAIFWTEFAAKHNNFTFRVAAADVPCYQYYSLDILGLLILFCSIIFYVTKLVIGLLKSVLYNPRAQKAAKSIKFKLQ